MYGGARNRRQGENLINPSNAFDANAYVAAKLYQLQTSGTEEEKAEWAGKTAADVVAAIAENGMSPVSHYEMFGATEANAGDVPLVQTVPVAQRVENDPARAEVTGDACAFQLQRAHASACRRHVGRGRSGDQACRRRRTWIQPEVEHGLDE